MLKIENFFYLFIFVMCGFTVNLSKEDDSMTVSAEEILSLNKEDKSQNELDLDIEENEEEDDDEDDDNEE